MHVYYIISNKGNIGCLNRSKLEKIYKTYNIFICDISEFKGHLLSSEYLD